MKKGLKKIIASMMIVLMFMNGSALAASDDTYMIIGTSGSQKVVATSPTYPIIMSATVDVSASFKLYSNSKIEGSSISLSFSNKSNISTISQNNKSTFTTGTFTGTAQRLFYATYTTSSGEYYAGGTAKVTCKCSSPGNFKNAEYTIVCDFGNVYKK